MPKNKQTAAVVLVEEMGSERWSIELKNFGQCRDRLGADVMAAFSRCFIHADRLASMVSFAYISLQRYGKESIAFNRNLHTMVWFTIGTLRELARATRDCRNALAKRGSLDPTSPPWARLRDFEARWDRDEAFRKMRDRAAFHVDSDVVSAGLELLAGEGDVVLSRGEGPRADDSSLTLGLLALHNGLGMDLETYGRFLDRVSEDQGVGSDIQEAFISAAESAGIPFGD
jgi:hypothetical protein